MNKEQVTELGVSIQKVQKEYVLSKLTREELLTELYMNPRLAHFDKEVWITKDGYLFRKLRKQQPLVQR